MRLRFTITGKPRGWARATPTTVRTTQGPRAVILTPKWMRVEQSRIRKEFTDKFPGHSPATGPVMLRFTAVFPIPKNFPAALRARAMAGDIYYTGKPDCDNIAKLIGDSLNGVAWRDDAQVQGGGVKRYGALERIDVDLEFIDDHPVTPNERLRSAKQNQGNLSLVQPRRRMPL